MPKVKLNFSKKISPNEKEEKGVPLVVTYHSSLNCLSKIIRGNLYLLYMNDEANKVFSPKSMISFISARNLSSYLVKAKLYLIDRTFESFKCTKKRREVCKNVNITDSFTSSVTQNTYKINHNVNCDDKCLIYLLTCKECRKQYVGKTTYAFRKRRKNYKSCARKFLTGESCVKQHLFEPRTHSFYRKCLYNSY